METAFYPIKDWWNRKRQATREERFFEKIYKHQYDACWEWIGGLDRDGYGRFVHEGGTKAHRFSYILANGPIPTNMEVLHRCDRPYCVNPDHLFLGTTIDNRADCVAKKRHTHGETHYKAVLTPEQVISIRAEYVYRKNSAGKLAKKYGIAIPTVRSILSGQSWKHLTTPEHRPAFHSELPPPLDEQG